MSEFIDTTGDRTMNHKEALTQAIILALTAPENRFHEAVSLAEGLAAFCSLAEVTEAQQNALDIFSKFSD